ncbi:MAG: LOG family protein YvdD [Ignavibacteria bacterium]|nr:LOG family protein YvdD [Ignavibacteria bacterium]
MKSICVFCGSNSGKGTKHLQTAQRLGKLIAEKNLTLIYGGGNIGIMGELANTVLQYNGDVTGVIPENLVQREAALKEVTNLIVVNSMHDRKAKMMELSDGFIAMSGGIGTLEEFFEVWTWAQLGIHSKPIGLLNTDNYFGGMIEFLTNSVSQEFLKREIFEMIIIDDNAESMIERMNNYTPLQVDKWIDKNQT